MRNFTLILSLLFVMSISEISAQEDQQINFYLNAGLGVSSLNLGINAGGNLRIDDVVVSIRGVSAATGIFGNAVEEYGLLVGYIKKMESGHYTLSAGLGTVSYNESKGLFAKNEISKSIGLAFEGQLCYSFLSFLGAGVTIYGNANGAKSFAGVSVNLFIGGLNL